MTMPADSALALTWPAPTYSRALFSFCFIKLSQKCTVWAARTPRSTTGLPRPRGSGWPVQTFAITSQGCSKFQLTSPNGEIWHIANIQTYKHTNIQTYKHTNIQTYKHTNMQTCKHTNIQTFKHTNIQTYKRTNIQTNIYLAMCVGVCMYVYYRCPHHWG